MRMVIRTDKENGNQTEVTIDFAIEKLMRADGFGVNANRELTGLEKEKQEYKSRLLAGTCQTLFFYYEVKQT